MPHSVFVVEDHPVMREGYIALLRAEPDLEVCGEAGSAEEALLQIEEANPDLVLLDLQLPGANGIELVKRIRALELPVKILVVSAHEESLYANRALKAGAQGYLTKYESARLAIHAIRSVIEDGQYFSETLRSQLLRDWIDGGEGSTGVDALTDRELEVFTHIGRGLTTHEIAAALSISHKTVESHRANIKAKLGIARVPELIQKAVVWVESPLN